MVLKMNEPIMSSSRPCYLSPTNWCNLRECFPSKSIECKLKKKKEVEYQDSQRIYNWAHHIDI